MNCENDMAPLKLGSGDSEAKKKKSKKNTTPINQEEEMQGVAVNSVACFQTQEREDQFITVDDAATLKLWDGKKQQLIEARPRFSNGMLATVAIEPTMGDMVACGGIDGKVHLFKINSDGPKSKKKQDNTIK